MSSMPGAGMMAARTALRVVEHCRVRGHDARALVESVGLSLEALSEPDARVHYEVVFRLGERALDLTNDPDFGLHLARDVADATQYDAGLLLLMASPTVRAALERFVSLQRFWGDGDRATLRSVPGGALIRYVLPGAEGRYARHSDECAMAEITLGVRALAGPTLAPRVVRFAHPAPASRAEHRAVFQCPLEFRAPATEIVFDDAVLDVPMPHASAAFGAVFEHQVERSLARIPTLRSTADHVRAVARAALGSGACTLDGTAGVLGVSARTLQRRLREEGTSFAEVVDLLRHETALVYLERRVPISEIALLLGYSDDTAFHHAFARWTGSSPKRYAMLLCNSWSGTPKG